MELQISISAYTEQNGLYKKADVIPADRALFDNLCYELDFEPKVKGYHATLIWSETSLPSESHVVQRSDKYIALCDRIDYLDGHDGLYVVAYVSAKRLQLRFQEFVDAGCKTTFDDFIPHITLASEVTRSDELTESIAELNRVLAKRPLTFTMVETEADDVKK